MRSVCLIVLYPLAHLLLATGVNELRAADKEDRARKVKVALALAAADAPKTVAKDTARTAKVAAALEAAGLPSPAPFVTVPIVAPAPMPREVLAMPEASPCDCLTTGECACGPGCKCRLEAAKTAEPAVRIVKRPKWLTDYNAAAKEVRATNRPLVMLFTDPVGCVFCRKLEAGALSDPAVRDLLAARVCLRVDVRTTEGAALAARYGQTAWPGVVVDKDGRLTSQSGDMPVETLLKLIR